MASGTTGPGGLDKPPGSDTKQDVVRAGRDKSRRRPAPSAEPLSPPAGSGLRAKSAFRGRSRGQGPCSRGTPIRPSIRGAIATGSLATAATAVSFPSAAVVDAEGDGSLRTG